MRLQARISPDKHLALLVNNAGIMAGPYATSVRQRLVIQW